VPFDSTSMVRVAKPLRRGASRRSRIGRAAPDHMFLAGSDKRVYRAARHTRSSKLKARRETEMTSLYFKLVGFAYAPVKKMPLIITAAPIFGGG
jgi:hypothetical protein